MTLFRIHCRRLALLALLGLVLFTGLVSAQEQNPAPPVENGTDGAATAESVATAPAPLRVIEHSAFQVGESLQYIVRYGRIIAGRTRLSIPEIIDYKGYPSYRVVSEAWSNPFFSRFYKVEDRLESLVDVNGVFSWRYEKHLREGKYKKDAVYLHDQVNRLAYAENDTLEIPPFVQDVLSILYYVRTFDLAPGDTVVVDNIDQDKVYPLNIVVHKRERVKVKAGKFDCLVVEPFLRTPGLFQQKGKIIVHLSDDRRKIPVKITTFIYLKGFSLGAIVAELEKVDGVVQ